MSRAAARAPSRKAAEEAASALRALAPNQRRKVPREASIVTGQGTNKVSVALPTEAYELCLRVLELMSTGQTATVIAVDEELTTQQAAELLNVSRPFVISLLEDGKIPHRMVGSHRRVQMTDLLAYKAKDDERRKAILNELTAEAEKHRLGY